MATLLLKFAAPLQSWGNSGSRFERRETGYFPTKSGVVGIIAAAMGRKRDDPIDDLKKFRMGVRIDKAGIPIADFQTVHFWDMSDLYTTRRMYLSDAEFTVALEGEDAFLMKVRDVLNDPFYPLYLGRRSCVPSKPIVLNGGLVDISMEDALRNVPANSGDSVMRILVEANEGNYRFEDDPISFNSSFRKYGARYMKEIDPVIRENEEHDVFNNI